MSGYLEVKYNFKSNLGLNPFKTWKRQWCILRPSPTWSGGSLAVYCSEAGAAAGAVELPAGGAVRRAKSRSRAHAFAVFSAAEPHKPRILLAAQTFQDAQLWMDKIRALLDGKQILRTAVLKHSYSVSIVPSELSRKLGLAGDGLVALSADGVLVSRSQKLEAFIEWRHVKDTSQITDSDKNKICVLNVHSSFHSGGCLRLSTPLAGALAAALRRGRGARAGRRSRSEGDLRAARGETGENRRSSWSSSAPPEVTLDDTDLLMLKESKCIPRGPLSRCAGAGHLPPAALGAPAADKLVAVDKLAASTRARLVASATIDDCMSDRRSLVSVASGIYEEIPDPPEHATASRDADPTRSRDEVDACGDSVSVSAGVCDSESGQWARWEEPTYESVAECVYATMRRARRAPPPLPPRLPFGTSKLGQSWNSRMNAPAEVTRHGSLGSLPRCHSLGSASDSHKTKTLPKSTRQAFSVFRKRLKSDSRLVSPKSAKENKDVETKKKKFDFTPTRDLFRNFKVGRKAKGPKITAGGLGKGGETKSCEFLDETERVGAPRGARSVECLEAEEPGLHDDGAALALPQEILELILRSRRLQAPPESDYMPMSPIVPPAPIEHHYMAMSPRTNLA